MHLYMMCFAIDNLIFVEPIPELSSKLHSVLPIVIFLFCGGIALELFCFNILHNCHQKNPIENRIVHNN